ncbi:MAG TPA: hypothetical protein VK822_19695, partial [Acetobacteraceae bacterium]|nr:hypothetical protein [Acetobacteraceae bacterium]
QGDQCVHPGSVFDPISARIAEELGFEIGMFAGSIASFTVLGAPDLIVLRSPNSPSRPIASTARENFRCWSTPTTATETH